MNDEDLADLKRKVVSLNTAYKRLDPRSHEAITLKIQINRSSSQVVAENQRRDALKKHLL